MRTAISSRDSSARCAREGTWFITNVALFALMPAAGERESKREIERVREKERVCVCDCVCVREREKEREWV